MNEPVSYLLHPKKVLQSPAITVTIEDPDLIGDNLDVLLYCMQYIVPMMRGCTVAISPLTRKEVGNLVWLIKETKVKESKYHKVTKSHDSKVVTIEAESEYA